MATARRPAPSARSPRTWSPPAGVIGAGAWNGTSPRACATMTRWCAPSHPVHAAVATRAALGCGDPQAPAIGAVPSARPARRRARGCAPGRSASRAAERNAVLTVRTPLRRARPQQPGGAPGADRGPQGVDAGVGDREPVRRRSSGRRARAGRSRARPCGGSPRACLLAPRPPPRASAIRCRGAASRVRRSPARGRWTATLSSSPRLVSQRPQASRRVLDPDRQGRAAAIAGERERWRQPVRADRRERAGAAEPGSGTRP